MMNGRQVAHLWANQSRESAKGSNFYFRGSTIYSYGSHFPIARLETIGKRRVCFFTSESYSSSTARHKSYARSAIRPETLIFEVPEVEGDDQRTRKINHDHLRRVVAVLVGRAAKSRSPADVLAYAEQARVAANLYRSLFYKRGKLIPKPRNWANLAAEYAAEQRANERKQAAKEKAREAKAAECEMELLQKWLAGEYGGYLHRSPVHFRLKPNAADTIQTTKGAEFPLEDGKAAFRFVLECRQQSRRFESNGRQIDVGGFRIDRIDESGNVIAGCHHIHWGQIEAFARLIGVYP